MIHVECEHTYVLRFKSNKIQAIVVALIVTKIYYIFRTLYVYKSASLKKQYKHITEETISVHPKQYLSLLP